MAGFRFEYIFDDYSQIEIDGKTVKFWIGYGLPDYEGDLEGFNEAFPKHMGYLIRIGIVKNVH